MSDLEALYQRILNDRWDRTNWLEFADGLDDHGYLATADAARRIGTNGQRTRRKLASVAFVVNDPFGDKGHQSNDNYAVRDSILNVEISALKFTIGLPVRNDPGYVGFFTFGPDDVIHPGCIYLPKADLERILAEADASQKFGRL